MNKIKQFTQVIRDNDPDIEYGTVITLKKIDDESELLLNRLAVLEEDKKVFIDECNKLRLENLELKKK